MQLKDSLTGDIRPVTVSSVSIYACGITPYSESHVGHARTYVVFDLLAKVLVSEGHTVQLVRNITDIDDKIIKVAQAEGVEWHVISERFAKMNRELMVATGLTVPLEPKASDYLAEIFELTQALLSKGLAYVSPTGDVLYRVQAYTGALLMNHKEGSLRSEQGQTRVDQEGKEDLRDFALWKRVPDYEPGFASPWGHGRPGWHIECSAMIAALFEGSVTIHGGGVDLKFPHHQAEIMQSEPVFGKPLAEVWMHNGSVLSDGLKMSKSLGNFVTWRDSLAKAETLAPGLGADLLRVSLLNTHWQKPLDWTDALLERTKADLLRLTKGLDGVTPGIGASVSAELSNNLNVPRAMHQLIQLRKQGDLAEVAAGLLLLGVDYAKWAQFKEPESTKLSPQDVAELVAQRNLARDAKDWARADELRDVLAGHGINLQDAAAMAAVVAAVIA